MLSENKQFAKKNKELQQQLNQFDHVNKRLHELENLPNQVTHLQHILECLVKENGELKMKRLEETTDKNSTIVSGGIEKFVTQNSNNSKKGMPLLTLHPYANKHASSSAVIRT